MEAKKCDFIANTSIHTVLTQPKWATFACQYNYVITPLPPLGFWVLRPALGPFRVCHHGPWACQKTQDPSGRGGVMYQTTHLKKACYVHVAKKSCWVGLGMDLLS
jgi:hypothetical protein